MQNTRFLNIALWVAQVLLAAMFLMAGVLKSSTPIDALSVTVPWVTEVPVALVRFIGVSEFLAGLGFLLPSILRIKPVLTPLAASGIVTIMVLAIVFHLLRGETPAVVFNLIIAAVAAFVAWGRFKKVPITAR